jgi:hypothetical protein
VVVTVDCLLSVRLHDYWHETITRDEALRRLDRRELGSERRARIEAEIPDVAEHFFTFHRVFREYLSLPDGVTKLILALPLRRDHDVYHVVAPMLQATRLGNEPKPQPAMIEFLPFRSVDGILHAADEPLTGFKFHRGPLYIHLDATPFVPSADEKLPIEDTNGNGGYYGGGGGGGGDGGAGGGGGEGGGVGGGEGGDTGVGSAGSEAGLSSGCCDACEWVHSHWRPLHLVDWMCCLGACN